ncbi:hypothetical protein SCHPADRAFT_896648 [Schizopora paradoxa]|uniref:Uncharacterized protein n=1 Tax=Schizopora paradoxa TaxID=27342 RepID=A0A0H2QZY6_9AGAM|nr:hypothetical protein SCHPADRAFT_896648 [Schizopora paradoxa]
MRLVVQGSCFNVIYDGDGKDFTIEDNNVGGRNYMTNVGIQSMVQAFCDVIAMEMNRNARLLAIMQKMILSQNIQEGGAVVNCVFDNVSVDLIDILGKRTVKSLGVSFTTINNKISQIHIDDVFRNLKSVELNAFSLHMESVPADLVPQVVEQFKAEQYRRASERSERGQLFARLKLNLILSLIVYFDKNFKFLEVSAMSLSAGGACNAILCQCVEIFCHVRLDDNEGKSVLPREDAGPLRSFRDVVERDLAFVRNGNLIRAVCGSTSEGNYLLVMRSLIFSFIGIAIKLQSILFCSGADASGLLLQTDRLASAFTKAGIRPTSMTDMPTPSHPAPLARAVLCMQLIEEKLSVVPTAITDLQATCDMAKGEETIGVCDRGARTFVAFGAIFIYEIVEDQLPVLHLSTFKIRWCGYSGSSISPMSAMLIQEFC